LREGRCDLGVFVEGPDTSGLAPVPFRRDELVIVLPARHRLSGRKPLPFADALDEDWISLNTGAAMLQKQQQAALTANRPLRLRMQVRSFDAVCHLVASGLGLAVLPKAAALPIIRATGLDWRPLADAWAQRQLLVAAAVGAQGDPVVNGLVEFLVQEPSQTAKSRRRS
jgi:DNA-binding transcriptional LysR family regulator